MRQCDKKANRASVIARKRIKPAERCYVNDMCYVIGARRVLALNDYNKTVVTVIAKELMAIHSYYLNSDSNIAENLINFFAKDCDTMERVSCEFAINKCLSMYKSNQEV